MRLSDEEKLLILLDRPDGAELVRIGAHWACIWREGREWHGALVHEVGLLAIPNGVVLVIRHPDPTLPDQVEQLVTRIFGKPADAVDRV